MALNDMCVVILNGSPYTGWTEVQVTQSFDKAAGEATVTLTEQPGVPCPCHVGDTAVVILAGQPVITGYVHQVKGRHSAKEHCITAMIRDKTQDFIDSTVGPGLEFKPPVPLKQVLQRTVGHMGLGIGVIDKASPEPYGPAEVAVAAVDDTGFGFADKWTRKRQVVLNTDGKGNLVIDRNRKQRGSGMLIKTFEDSPANNVLEADYETTDLNQHNKTSCAGQKSHNDRDYWESKPKGFEPGQANPLSTHWGEAHNTAVRPERKLHYRGMKGIEGTTPQKAAQWRSNTAKARGYTYKAKVQGFTMGAGGQLWWPGFIIPVRDDHFEISDELFIKEVTFHKTWEGGSTTDICCTTKDAFSDQDEGGGRNSKRGAGTRGPGSFPAG